uniref:Free fatty acid receptor 1 n=1 Tax=Chrysemys picta bellii TaxID=8478 RepID=A0A8C3FLY4_CHRPI
MRGRVPFIGSHCGAGCLSYFGIPAPGPHRGIHSPWGIIQPCPRLGGRSLPLSRSSWGARGRKARGAGRPPAPPRVFMALWPSHVILEVVPPGWSPPSFLCPLYSLAHFGTLYASTCFLTAVSAGRYLGAAFPIRYQLYKKPLYSCLVCVAIWTLVAFHGVLLLILETSLGANATLFMGNGTACYQEFSPEQLALLAPVRLELSVALFFLPLVITVFCYAGCIHVLVKSRLHEQKKRRAVRLALATLSVFVLCFGPYNLSHVVGYARGEDVWWRRVALLPGACNAFLDPLIFYFLSSAKDHGLAWVWRSVGQRWSN